MIVSGVAPASWNWAPLAGGVAVYLAGHAWFRALLGIGPVGARLVAAALVLATAWLAAVAAVAGGVAQLAAVVIVVAGALVADRGGPPRRRVAPGEG